MASTCLTPDIVSDCGQALTRDGFLNGDVTAFQPRDGYRAAIDPVLLAAAINPDMGQSVLELGCGSGIALLCLCKRMTGVVASGLEIYPFHVELARRNAVENGLKIDIWHGDIANPPKDLLRNSFDFVIANPPFRIKDRGKLPANESRRIAEVETVPLSVWLESAAQQLKSSGQLAMIIPPARLPDLLCCLPGTTLGGVIEVKPVRARPDRAAVRLLLRAHKTSSPLDFVLLPDLILHTNDGNKFSPEAESILRNASRIEF
ncbi:MAG: methyltransferase [Rhodobacteraceae bacterium]|nr:methyltransferase [Paracoccaceae bacterium]